MSARDSSLRFYRSLRHLSNPSICNRCLATRRQLSSNAGAYPIRDALSEIEQETGLKSSSSAANGNGNGNGASTFDPLKAPRARKTQLTPSRYQFRSPKYYRGPMHPHQPLPSSDPASREFIPGPFSSPCLQETYHSTIAPDLMTLTYQHRPPGFIPPNRGPRLREWVGDSPYFANRPPRGPRGGDVLRLLRKPITPTTIPTVHSITVHSFVNAVVHSGSGPLHVAGMVLQAITNVRVQTHKSRTAAQQWGIMPGKQTIAATATLKGEDMWHFMQKLTKVVLPRIKEWKGVKATTGDGSGNLGFGLTPEMVALWPEVEINFDSYPAKMIPGCHITIQTTAVADKDARLLLQGAGIPFWGKAKK